MSSNVAGMAKPIRIHGRVLDRRGSGLQSMVHIVEKRTGERAREGSERVLRTVATDPQGSFDFEMELPARDPSIDRSVWNALVHQLVATASGYGPTASDLIQVRRGQPIELRLAKDDVPIDGLVLDAYGKPVAGAVIRVALLDHGDETDLEQRLAGLRRTQGQQAEGKLWLYSDIKPDFLVTGLDSDANERIYARRLHFSRFCGGPVVTDSEGRFRVHGIGSNRALALELSGPGIVKSWISVVTRTMEPIDSSLFIGGTSQITYGARFTHTAQPSTTVVGRISDSQTGEPIPGVLVESNHGQTGYVADTTAADGTYQLEGLPKVERYSLEIIPPNDAPYFKQSLAPVARETGEAAQKRADITLVRTLWCVGRVLDKRNGKPVQARVLYSPLVGNPNAVQHETALSSGGDPFELAGNCVATDVAGNFRVRVIEGEGLLFVGCRDMAYVTLESESANKDEKWWGPTERTVEGARMTKTYQPMVAEWVHAMKPIQVDASQTELTCDLTVDPGYTLDIQMVDMSKQPLTDVSVIGRIPVGFQLPEKPTTDAHVTIPGLSPQLPRPVFFYHQGRNLGAFLLAQPTRSEHQTVTLQPCGTIRGRLLDQEGKPLSQGVPIRIVPRGLVKYPQEFVIARTDQDGRFESKRMIPGVQLDIETLAPTPYPISPTVLFEPGETKDLGEIRVSPLLRKKADGLTF